MKKQKTFFLLSILLLGLFVKAQNTQIEMNLWNRYTMFIENNSIIKSDFSLARGYFRIDHKFNNYISGRFNLDFFSSDNAIDGASIKLKYAYLKFNTNINSNIYFGLTKTYFGTIYSWDYITIDKALEDKNKIVSSADYGIVYEQKLPRKIGEIYFQLINGEGYKATDSNINIKPAYLMNITLNPISMFSITTSGIYEKSGILDTIKTNYDERRAYSINGNISLTYFEIMFQWLYGKKDTVESQGYMIVPIVHLNNLIGKDIEFVGRYENYDKNIAINNDAYSMIMLGLNYYILRRAQNKPAVMIQINGARKTNEDNSYEDNIEMQIRWEFKSTINN